MAGIDTSTPRDHVHSVARHKPGCGPHVRSFKIINKDGRSHVASWPVEYHVGDSGAAELGALFEKLTADRTPDPYDSLNYYCALLRTMLEFYQHLSRLNCTEKHMIAPLRLVLANLADRINAASAVSPTTGDSVQVLMKHQKIDEARALAAAMAYHLDAFLNRHRLVSAGILTAEERDDMVITVARVKLIFGLMWKMFDLGLCA